MHFLFEFLLKRSTFLLFLALELLCAFLVINYSKTGKQKQIFLASSNYFAGKVYSVIRGVKEYSELDDVADSLSNENARLRERLLSSRYINFASKDTVRQIKIDSVGSDSILQQFVFTGATVINNSIVSNNNFFTLDKGAQHGIGTGMGVLGMEGIAGVVVSVSPHYSKAISLLNRSLRISGHVKTGGKLYFGTLTWDGKDPYFLNMNDVPKSSPIAKGDTVVTSGYSTIFPQGYLIGTVDSFFVPPGSPSYKIRVKLTEDIPGLRRVYVVENKMRKEIKSLESENE